MATKIVTKNSSTASAVPTASDLVQGELAVNVADKRLFTEDNGGSIVELGTNPSTLTVTGEITANGGIALGDSDKATFGASDDLQIYHDGSNSYIKDTGTGDLRIWADSPNIATAAGNKIFYGNNGSAELYTTGGAKRLSATGSGIDVTGTVTMDGLTVDTSAVGGFKVTNEATSGVHLTTYQGTTNSNVRTAYVDSQEFVVSTGAPTGTTVTERFRIDSSGNVGIGTSSPSSVLHISTSNDPKITLTDTGFGASADITGSNGNLRLNSQTATIFDMADSEAMRIDSSGKVGIGTSSPQAPLHVAGNILCDAFNNGGEGNGLFFRKDFLTTAQPSITLKDHNGNAADGLSINAFDGISFSLNDSEKMVIDDGGNVGIGTDSPDSGYKLDVAGNVVFGDGGGFDMNVDGSRWQFSLGGSEKMRIFSDGDVSIGMTDNYAKLNVNGHVRAENSAFLAGREDAANPAFAFHDDTDTGMFNIASNILAFATGGSERMRIDSSGSVGIGTSNPTVGKLQVNDSGGAILALTRTSGQASDDLGVIRFGNTDIDSNLANIRGLQDGATNSSALTFETQSAGGANTERMRIDSSGNVLVGGTSENAEGSFTIRPNNSNGSCMVQINRDDTTATSNAFVFYNEGTGVGAITYNNTATSYNTSSDYRLKEDWQPVENATDRLKELKPCNFAWKADGSRVDGFLAHELQEVVPEAVTGTKDAMTTEEYEVTPAVYEDVVIPAVEAVEAEYDEEGNVVVEAVEAQEERTEQQLVSEAVMGEREVPDYQGIDQSKLVPLLVATIQELEARITQLENN